VRPVTDPQPVDRDLCQQFRDAFEDGRSVGQIAENSDYARSTVRVHVHDRCTHTLDGAEWGTSTDAECPLCGDVVPDRKLAWHIADCPAVNSDEVDA
jgi:hypothetical protein